MPVGHSHGGGTVSGAQGLACPSLRSPGYSAVLGDTGSAPVWCWCWKEGALLSGDRVSAFPEPGKLDLQGHG